VITDGTQKIEVLELRKIDAGKISLQRTTSPQLNKARQPVRRLLNAKPRSVDISRLPPL